jgi:hypothetical protein
MSSIQCAGCNSRRAAVGPRHWAGWFAILIATRRGAWDDRGRGDGAPSSGVARSDPGARLPDPRRPQLSEYLVRMLLDAQPVTVEVGATALCVVAGLRAWFPLLCV